MLGFKLWRLGSYYFSILPACMHAVYHMMYMMSHTTLICFQCQPTVSVTLDLFLHGQSVPNWVLILSSRTGTILAQGPDQGPERLFITSGWQYCYMEPSGCSEGLASSPKVKRPHHLMDRSFQAAPKTQFLYCPQSTQDNPEGG